MSAGASNIQAQVESVLGELLRVAAVELTKLFEGRYRASAAAGDADAGRTEDGKSGERADTRSIGVQVDAGAEPPMEPAGLPLPSDGGFSGESREEGCLTPPDIPLAEDKGQDDPGRLRPRDEVQAQTLETVELNTVEAESPADGGLQTEAVLHDVQGESSQSAPAEQRILLIGPDSRKKVKFVCPLILKPGSPASKPNHSEKPAQVEPQQACVSTARGTAYSPSPFDGAVTPVQGGVWERIHMPKEAKNHLQMKLKLTSPDQKLMRPCAVQLVNLLAVPGVERKRQAGGAGGKAECSLPKDLRRHQGLHTGHRLCCFTACGNGIWRLQKIVPRSRDGYACGSCGKTFKHRKILRRHERFHTGEKPYACTQCSKTFALRKSLRRHLRFHTGERPHTCTLCSKSFRLRDNLKAHLRFHTGEKPFSCASCGKTFRIMRNLEEHKLSPCGLFVPSFRTIAGL